MPVSHVSIESLFAFVSCFGHAEGVLPRLFWMFLLALVMTTSGAFVSLGFAEKAQPISNLERALFQTAYPQDADAIRLQRLETQLGLPSTGSTSLRLNRIYQRQQQSVHSSPVPAAVAAYNQGIDAAAQRQFKAAQTAYETALKADPAFVPAYNNLADILMQSGEAEKAIALYQRALQLAPTDAALYRNLAVGFERAGRVPEAMRAYENYLSMAPAPDPVIGHLVAEYQQARADSKTLVHYADRAVEASNGRPMLWPLADAYVVPVYIDSQADDGDLFIPTVRDALNTWENALHKRVRFQEQRRLLSKKSFKGIWISLQPGPLSHPFLDVGHAHFESQVLTDDNSESILSTVNDLQHKPAAVSPERVWITLNVGHRDEALSLRIRQVKRLALHELGHAVGIWGHSANPQDIMYTHPIVDSLSPRDVGTINALYDQQQSLNATRHSWQSFDRGPAY